jgi:hypothetical protein
MTVSDIAQQRLQNQHLAALAFKNPVEIVQYMGAIQAQDYAGAAWAVGQRLQGATQSVIDKALAEGEIIRTHVMRPTWHFVTPKDIRWMLALTAPRIQAIAAFRHRQLKLDKDIFAQCEKILSKKLAADRQLTRNEITDVLQKDGIATDEQRFVHIMMQMELIGLVCSGGKQGKQFTYALLDERVPQTKAFDRDESLAALAERYFTSHGPATLHDYVWWSGLTVTDAKAGLEMVRSKLNSEMVDGNTYWFAASVQPVQSKKSAALLLPNYDEYIVSYKDRSASIASSDIDKTDPRGTIFNNTLLINGRVAGIWKRSFGKNKVNINIIPFAPLNKTNHAAIAAAAKRYAAFLELKDFTLNI